MDIFEIVKENKRALKLLNVVLGSLILDEWREELHPRGGNPKNKGWFSRSKSSTNWK